MEASVKVSASTAPYKDVADRIAEEKERERKTQELPKRRTLTDAMHELFPASQRRGPMARRAARDFIRHVNRSGRIRRLAGLV